jgi:ParB family transcriptional regulator, chromosome partitioning protein
MMELEFHQLDRRYERLRRRAPEREKRLLGSLALVGQQTPIVVVGGEAGRWVVVDGYKRIRALRRLKVDTVVATQWDLDEADALILERLMRAAGGDDAFEQGWLLGDLEKRFGLSHEELARRFDKSQSWVSRRLALVDQLPAELQQRVHSGQLVPHAAMKYLVPMARANRAASLQLCEALGKRKPSSRQMGALYGAWLCGDVQQRERLLADPWLFLRAQEEAQRDNDDNKPPAQQLLSDLGGIAALSRRGSARLRKGLAQKLSAAEREEAKRCQAQARADSEALFHQLDQELG